MLLLKNMLMIGGAGRNVGKTTYSCSVIKRFSSKYDIVAIKIKTIYEGDDFFHGKDRNPLKGNYKIIEEKVENGNEDSQLMLKAGAKKVFRIKAKNYFLREAFAAFYKLIPKNVFIICETNSLRKAIKPGLFLMIKFQNSDNMKPSAKELERLADRIIFTDGNKHDFDVENLIIKKRKWEIISEV